MIISLSTLKSDNSFFLSPPIKKKGLKNEENKVRYQNEIFENYKDW
jgi:hypothetical protein